MGVRRKLDPDDVRHYHEQGYVLLGPLLSPQEIARMRAEEERFRPPVGYGAQSNQNLRVNIQLCNRSEPIRRFCTQGSHIPLLQQLAGPDLCLTHQQFVTKLPDEADERSDIPWHQDNGYGRLEPMTDVTVWVPLVDTDENNACLKVIPRSHEAGLLEHDTAGVNPVLREVAGHEGTEVSLPLCAGEGVAFTGLTLHASGPNHSGRERPAFYARYCDPQATMEGEDGRRALDDPHSWMVCGEAS